MHAENPSNLQRCKSGQSRALRRQGRR